MSSVVINVCHGWSCPLVTKCGRSDFNLPGELYGWVRHFQSPQVGDNCPQFVHVDQWHWGDGPEPKG